MWNNNEFLNWILVLGQDFVNKGADADCVCHVSTQDVKCWGSSLSHKTFWRKLNQPWLLYRHGRFCLNEVWWHTAGDCNGLYKLLTIDEGNTDTGLKLFSNNCIITVLVIFSTYFRGLETLTGMRCLRLRGRGEDTPWSVTWSGHCLPSSHLCKQQIIQFSLSFSVVHWDITMDYTLKNHGLKHWVYQNKNSLFQKSCICLCAPRDGEHCLPLETAWNINREMSKCHSLPSLNVSWVPLVKNWDL